ncbi:hypothetical protein C8J57DRAFT_1531205 [Mycena rebaudengoi]|nr:hypothetical protein C8J57DRAFT_1531205 [Mycena rebaudengoi]
MPLVLSPQELANAKVGLLAFLRRPHVDPHCHPLHLMFVTCFALQESKFKETPEFLRAAMDFLLPSYLCRSIRDQLLRRKPAQFCTPNHGHTDPRLQPWPIGEADIGLGSRPYSEVVALLLRWAQRAPSGHTVFSLLGALIQLWSPTGSRSCPLMESHLAVAVHLYYIDPDPIADFFCRIAHSCSQLCNPLLSTPQHATQLPALRRRLTREYLLDSPPAGKAGGGDGSHADVA